MKANNFANWFNYREYTTLRDLICNTLSKLGEQFNNSFVDHHTDGEETSTDDKLKELLVQRCSDQATGNIRIFFDNHQTSTYVSMTVLLSELFLCDSLIYQKSTFYCCVPSIIH